MVRIDMIQVNKIVILNNITKNEYNLDNLGHCLDPCDQVDYFLLLYIHYYHKDGHFAIGSSIGPSILTVMTHVYQYDILYHIDQLCDEQSAKSYMNHHSTWHLMVGTRNETFQVAFND